MMKIQNKAAGTAEEGATLETPLWKELHFRPDVMIFNMIFVQK